MKTGYAPGHMIDVVRLLKNQELFEIARAREEKREPRVYHGVFASHPDNDQRLHEVVKAADKLKGGPTDNLDPGPREVSEVDRRPADGAEPLAGRAQGQSLLSRRTWA